VPGEPDSGPSTNHTGLPKDGTHATVGTLAVVGGVVPVLVAGGGRVFRVVSAVEARSFAAGVVLFSRPGS